AQTPREVIQTNPDDLRVRIGLDNEAPVFVTLAHGVDTLVWDPAADHSLHLKSFILSVESAGMVQIFRDATEWCRLHFNEKKAVPVPFPTDVTLPVDEILRATYTGDVGADNAFITAIGHEHEV
ncbi:unnamed protein product, partial [marine sediment metagenome]